MTEEQTLWGTLEVPAKACQEQYGVKLPDTFGFVSVSLSSSSNVESKSDLKGNIFPFKNQKSDCLPSWFLLRYLDTVRSIYFH